VIEVHSHVHLDGRELFTSVERQSVANQRRTGHAGVAGERADPDREKPRPVSSWAGFPFPGGPYGGEIRVTPPGERGIYRMRPAN
jgi:hypothetical protein